VHASSGEINLKLLRSLDAILETRNLTHAAERLGLTQSALSRQLAQLRACLGDPILIREGRHYVLSDRAVAVRDALKAAIDGVESLFEIPHFDASTCTRRFVLSGSDYIAEHMLPEMMQIFQRLAPKLRIEFLLWRPDNYRALSEEGVDLVPTIANAVPDNLHGRSMGQDRPVCLMRAEHPLAGKTMTTRHLTTWPHIRISAGGDKDSLVDRYLADRGLEREVRLSVPFFAPALRLVLQSDLLLILPEHIAINWSRSCSVVWKPLPFKQLVHQYWLLWHARSHSDPAHQWFRNQVHSVMHRSIQGVTQFNVAG
jgi:DNA-binding transcriptional LysR family regulator